MTIRMTNSKLTAFLMACDFALRLKTLKGLSSLRIRLQTLDDRT